MPSIEQLHPSESRCLALGNRAGRPQGKAGHIQHEIQPGLPTGRSQTKPELTDPTRKPETITQVEETFDESLCAGTGHGIPTGISLHPAALAKTPLTDEHHLSAQHAVPRGGLGTTRCALHPHRTGRRLRLGRERNWFQSSALLLTQITARGTQKSNLSTRAPKGISDPSRFPLTNSSGTLLMG